MTTYNLQEKLASGRRVESFCTDRARARGVVVFQFTMNQTFHRIRVRWLNYFLDDSQLTSRTKPFTLGHHAWTSTNWWMRSTEPAMSTFITSKTQPLLTTSTFDMTTRMVQAYLLGHKLWSFDGVTTPVLKPFHRVGTERG